MNLWAKFQALNAGSPRHVGEVTAINARFSDQRCTVTLIPSGVSIEVNGTGRSLEIGQRWLIQNGRIIEEGPSGTVLTADV